MTSSAARTAGTTSTVRESRTPTSPRSGPCPPVRVATGAVARCGGVGGGAVVGCLTERGIPQPSAR